MFFKKKEAKKVATAEDFNKGPFGMALQILPFLPLLILLVINLFK